jgi:hypothetical protein
VRSGYTQHAILQLDSQGNAAAGSWLGTIHGTNDQAASGIADAKMTLELSFSVVESPCGIQPNDMLFVFSPDGGHLVAYCIWSEENVLADVEISIPATQDQGIITEEANAIGQLASVANTIVDSAVNAGNQPTTQPTSTPTITPTPTHTPTPTSTATPTATPTATATRVDNNTLAPPTPVATIKVVSRHHKACKKGSHRVHGKCKKKG